MEGIAAGQHGALQQARKDGGIALDLSALFLGQFQADKVLHVAKDQV